MAEIAILTLGTFTPYSEHPPHCREPYAVERSGLVTANVNPFRYAIFVSQAKPMFDFLPKFLRASRRARGIEM